MQARLPGPWRGSDSKTSTKISRARDVICGTERNPDDPPETEHRPLAKVAETETRLNHDARRVPVTKRPKEGEKAWTRLEGLLESRECDDAVTLTTDLWEAAAASDRTGDFETRLAAVRNQHPRCQR